MYGEKIHPVSIDANRFSPSFLSYVSLPNETKMYSNSGIGEKRLDDWLLNLKIIHLLNATRTSMEKNDIIRCPEF